MPNFVRQPPAALEDAILVAGGEVDEYHICLGYYATDSIPTSFRLSSAENRPHQV